MNQFWLGVVCCIVFEYVALSAFLGIQAGRVTEGSMAYRVFLVFVGTLMWPIVLVRTAWMNRDA